MERQRAKRRGAANSPTQVLPGGCLIKRTCGFLTSIIQPLFHSFIHGADVRQSHLCHTSSESTSPLSLSHLLLLLALHHTQQDLIELPSNTQAHIAITSSPTLLLSLP